MTHKSTIATKILKVKAGPYTQTRPTLKREEEVLVLVKIEETTTHLNGMLHGSYFSVGYEVISPASCKSHSQTQFDGQYQCATIGSKAKVAITGRLTAGSVFLDPIDIRGRRIGSYLMNEIVKWAKRWPDAEVKNISLNANQAGTTYEFSKERRNKFYENAGVRFEESGNTTKDGGTSLDMLAADLKEVHSWKDNIEVIELVEDWKKLRAENTALQASIDKTNCSAADWKLKIAKAKKCTLILTAVGTTMAWIILLFALSKLRTGL